MRGLRTRNKKLSVTSVKLELPRSHALQCQGWSAAQHWTHNARTGSPVKN